MWWSSPIDIAKKRGDLARVLGHGWGRKLRRAIFPRVFSQAWHANRPHLLGRSFSDSLCDTSSRPTPSKAYRTRCRTLAVLWRPP